MIKITGYRLEITCYNIVLILVASCLLSLTPLWGQQKNIPLTREWSLNAEKTFDSIKPAYVTTIEKCYTPVSHTSFRPQIESKGITIDKLTEMNSGAYQHAVKKGKTVNGYTNHGKNRFVRKLKFHNLITVKDSADQFHLTIDPLFNFEKGKDQQDTSEENLYKNTRGILVRGDIGKKFSFETSFLENQATFATYIDEHIKAGNKYFPNAINYPFNVIPGQGRSKAFKKTGYDFAMASGYISYSPDHHVNVQIGTGKHFVGDGYRSLLLSDNAFNYPFARVTTSFGKFQYTNLYTSFMNLTDGGVTTPPGTERLFQKKSGSFQFLSWNAHQRIQLGLFQGMIWEASDTMGSQHLNAYYYNPIIGISALTYGPNDTNNVVLGLTGKIKVTNSILLYGQFMMDDYTKDFWGGDLRNKHGFQAGIKYFDFMRIKNLHLQAEYNEARPYSYAHKSPAQSYTHYNEPLAHPLGANFRESIGFINYRIGDFFAEIKTSYAIIGKDSIGKNYGNTIFNSDNNADYSAGGNSYTWLQGIKTSLIHNSFHIGYLINPSTNFNVVIGASIRNMKNDYTSAKTEFFFFAIRTSLSNHYYDF